MRRDKPERIGFLRVRENYENRESTSWRRELGRVEPNIIVQKVVVRPVV